MTVTVGVWADVQLLRALPYRQFFFTLPKAYRVFPRHGHRLFGQISRLIFSLTAFSTPFTVIPPTGAPACGQSRAFRPIPARV